MSDMSASVILRLVDDLSGPARKAAASVKSLVKDLEKLKGLSGKSFGGATKQLNSLTRDIKKATEATKLLRRSMERPPTAGFTKAAQGIGKIKAEADRAANAVRSLNRAMGRSGGSVRPSGGSGGGGGHGGGGGRSGGSHGGGWFGGHHASHAGRHIGRHMIGTAGGMAFYAMGGEIAEGIGESIRSGMEQSFEKEHTKTMLKMQGESAGDIAAAVAQANKMARTLPSFTSAQHLESIAELRPALIGGLSEATKLAPMFQRSVAVLEAVKQGAGAKALGGVNTHGEALDLVRALEIKGETSHKGWTEDQNDKNMDHYVNSITKAIVGMNGQVKAADFHSAFKFSRGDASNWSEEFSTEILPTIMNELKKSSKTDASQTGNALKSMSRAVVDNVMTPQALAAWDKLGMYGPGALKKGKGGKLSVNTGEHMLGYDVFQTNPYQFVQDYLLPHMKEHGIDINNRKDVVAQLGGLFGNRTANAIAAILATQQAQIKKDQENIRKATGTSGLDFLMNADPTMRMHVFASSLKELGGALGDLTLPGNMRGMKGIIDWAHSFADTIHNSAYAKKLGGYWESMIAGMFGQKMGRFGMMGRNPEYYGAGKSLGEGWSHFTSSTGKMLKFWEEIGFFSASVKVAGAALNALGTASDGVRAALEGMKSASSGLAKWVEDKVNGFTKAPSYNEAKKAIETVAPPTAAPQVAQATKDIVASLQPIAKLLPLQKLPPMVRGGSSLASRLAPPSLPTFASGASFGSSAIQPIASAAKSATPMFAQAGSSAMAALAGGLQSGSGQATSSMATLMANLAAIGSKGVTVPVNLDTSAAEAKLSALMAKAGSIGSGGMKGSSNGQFSKALSDLGQ